MWNPVLVKSLHHRILRGSTEAAMKIALRIMLACACALPFQGSCQTTEHNAAIYRYRGADREQRMLEQARSEGTVVVYTSLAPTESTPLARAFEKKTGVKVELWRALSEKPVPRSSTEARAGRYAFDVIRTHRPRMGVGEIPVGPTVYNSNAESLKRKGAPIDWLPVDPVVARPQGIALGRNAPHPHAALAFADFVLSPEGQELLSSMGRVPVSTRVQ